MPKKYKRWMLIIRFMDSGLIVMNVTVTALISFYLGVWLALVYGSAMAAVTVMALCHTKRIERGIADLVELQKVNKEMKRMTEGFRQLNGVNLELLRFAGEEKNQCQD